MTLAYTDMMPREREINDCVVFGMGSFTGK